MAYEIEFQCIACGLCQSVCTKGAIAESDVRYRILVENCTECGDCLEICPLDCIVPIPQPSHSKANVKKS